MEKKLRLVIYQRDVPEKRDTYMSYGSFPGLTPVIHRSGFSSIGSMKAVFLLQCVVSWGIILRIPEG